MNAVFQDTIRKQYFSRPEVAVQLGVNASTVRFWQKTFGLKPKASIGNRTYISRDTLALLHHVKRLVKEEKHTIEGAKIKLREAKLI
jgi:DNA-binding transcriptional MerR regulator